MLTRNVLVRAGLLGVVAGMRSQLPMALLAVAAYGGDFAQEAGRPLSFFRSRPVQIGFAVSSVGELIGDKLPHTPSRIAPAPLAGRTVFGGLAGAALALNAGRSPVLPAAVGAVGAIAGSFAGYQARVSLGRATGLPDPVWAVVEDAVALAGGALAFDPRLD